MNQGKFPISGQTHKENKDVDLSQILSLNCPNFDLSMVPLAPPCAATWSLAQTAETMRALEKCDETLSLRTLRRLSLDENVAQPQFMWPLHYMYFIRYIYIYILYIILCVYVYYITHFVYYYVLLCMCIYIHTYIQYSIVQ